MWIIYFKRKLKDGKYLETYFEINFVFTILIKIILFATK